MTTQLQLINIIIIIIIIIIKLLVASLVKTFYSKIVHYSF